jgi:hypothetical protein
MVGSSEAFSSFQLTQQATPIIPGSIETEIVRPRDLARLPDFYGYLEKCARVLDELALIVGILLAVAVTVPLAAASSVAVGQMLLLIIPAVGFGCTLIFWQGMKYCAAMTLLLLDIGRSLRSRTSVE